MMIAPKPIIIFSISVSIGFLNPKYKSLYILFTVCDKHVQYSKILEDRFLVVLNQFLTNQHLTSKLYHQMLYVYVQQLLIFHSYY